MTKNFRESVQEAVETALDAGDAMQCTRVWSAWSHGTMSEDDFVYASDGDLGAEITDAVLNVFEEYAHLIDTERNPVNPL